MPKLLFGVMVAAACISSMLLLPALAEAAGGAGISWEQFKQRFMSDDGRIIDRYQNSVSHSEGQGYGMLLAWANDDRKTFDLLWEWSRNNLQVRKSDSLLAWKWGERSPGQWKVIDFNNATDGDLLVAMSLLLAHEKWGEQKYKDQALEITGDIREFLLLEKNGLLCLLPGYFGFIHEQHVMLNPSYLIFPVFQIFARYDDQALWTRAYDDSHALLKAAVESNPLQLPPDWINWGANGVAAPADKGAVFSYEAIRVPLYLSWEGKVDAVPGLKNLLERVSALGTAPPSVNLQNQSMSLQDAAAGFYAVLARAAGELGMDALGEKLWTRAEEKVAAEESDYYSNVLYLLARTRLQQ